MSRTGRAPVRLAEGVEATLEAGELTVRGRRGSEVVRVHPAVRVAIGEGEIVVRPARDGVRLRGHEAAMWGTMRALVANAARGVHDGFEKRLELHGVGYRALVQGSGLVLTLGFSHPVDMEIPPDIEVEVEAGRLPVLVVRGNNRQRVGQFAALIRRHRPPEPYGGKGVRYQGELIVLKAGKKK